MPSDAKLMQIAVSDLNNASLSLEDRHRALHELLILVEPIDNANGNLLSLSFVCSLVQMSFDQLLLLCNRFEQIRRA